MTLDQYLSANEIKEAAFAELIGVDQSTVNRLRKGQVPSKPIMEKIFLETGGVVRADDFFGLCPDTPGDPIPERTGKAA